MRFAERVVRGLSEDGSPQETVVWIERRPGALWAVGRVADQRSRQAATTRLGDYVFEGSKLAEVLAAANGTLRDELAIAKAAGVETEVPPFTDAELLGPLDRWMFGRSSD